MTGQTNLVPKRRFKEFQNTHPWEKRELDSIYKKIRNAFVGTATPYYVEFGNFYLESNNVKDGKINRITEVFINDEFYEKQKDKWLHTSDLVMVQSGHVGHTAVIEEELDGTAAHALIMFQEYKEQVDPYFLNFQFQTKEAKRKLDNITTGNTIKHILASEMKKFKVIITQIKEQKKIVTFFKVLDDIIDLQQSKLEKTKALKSAYLSEMFPAEGECEPKRRFTGFTQAWEQRKLGEVLKINSGRDYKHLNEGDIPVYGTGGYMLSVDDKLSSVDGIGIGRKGTIDKPQYLKAPFWTVDTLFFMTPMVNYDLQFLFSMSQNIKWKQMDESTGVPSLSKAVIEGIYRSFPSYKEQVKIGLFFKKLDETVDFHQRKLEKLKNIKKAYLNEMFV